MEPFLCSDALSVTRASAAASSISLFSAQVGRLKSIYGPLSDPCVLQQQLIQDRCGTAREVLEGAY